MRGTRSHDRPHGHDPEMIDTTDSSAAIGAGNVVRNPVAPGAQVCLVPAAGDDQVATAAREWAE